MIKFAPTSIKIISSISLIVSILFFALGGCSEKRAELPATVSSSDAITLPSPAENKETVAQTNVILKKVDSLRLPQQYILKDPPTTELNNNRKKITSPEIELLKNHVLVHTLGEKNIKKPTQTPANGVVRPSIFPIPKDAREPATKDASYYNLNYLDVEHGLGSSYVMDIIEDSRGNLWLSNWAAGICVYNSKTFLNYTENENLINNYIWTIFEDSKGRIWFGSDGGGASFFDGNQFVEYSTSNGLAGDLVYDIVEDENANIWFATNNGLTKYDGEKFFTYRSDNGLLGESISALYVGNNNRLLIASEKGFSILDGVSFTNYTVNNGLPSNEITAIFEDSEENIWIGTRDDGITMFDGYTFFTFDTEQGLSGNSITTICEDKYNRIWIGTQNNGISIYDRYSFTIIKLNEGLSSNTVRAFYEDNDDNMWIGTYGGLNKFNRRSFINYTEMQGLGGELVRGISEDNNGDLWLGHSNGASKLTQDGFKNYTAENGLTDSPIRVIKQDYKGNLWFGTDSDGAYYFDGSNFTHYTNENGLSGNTILSMHEDKNKAIWFGTYESGLTKFDGKDFYHLTINEGLSSNTIRAIAEDDDGNMWFGTNMGGLEKFNGVYLEHLSKNDGLAENTILSLKYDSRGLLWAGTENNGVNILYQDKIFHISEENGLSNNIIWSITEDYDQNIWLGTEKGLNTIIFNDKMNYKISTFGKLDGLKGTDFYPNASYLDEENRIWWGTGKALTFLDLNEYEWTSKAPKVAITNILINEENIDFRTLKTAKKQNQIYRKGNLSMSALSEMEYQNVIPFSNCPSELSIPYELNHLIIAFSANDWAAPHKIKYMHKLEGASSEWHPVLNDNKVVYSFLPEGNYTFHLKAKGESGLWSETLRFPFTVSPPWWRSIFAYIVYIIILMGLIILAISSRTKKLIDQRKKLELLVHKRTREVVKQKELVELKNKEIIDSINYAKRIQRAILPSSGMVKRKLANAFIYFKPKDIVAGDFYWLEEKDNKILLAVADCTGHGVPGAMVSLVCNNTLSRAVSEFKLTDPARILNMVRDIVIESFTNSREEVKDGMDIALISLDIKTKILRFSGANSNLYVFSGDELTTLKGDRQPIGKYVVSNDFSVKEIQLKPGDSFYMFTDGFADQFGGPHGKKFKTTPFIKMLESIQHLTMLQQKKHIESVFDEWSLNVEQVDDVCVVGVRI